MTSPARAAIEVCPGCGLETAPSSVPVGVYFNASTGCWATFGEVTAREFSDYRYGRLHQLSVDTYASQHVGGRHPDKSIAIHLVGLLLAIERGVTAQAIATLHRRLAETVRDWPHFEAPADFGGVRTDSVARARTPESHARAVEGWAASVWRAWSAQHAAIESFANASGVTALTERQPRAS